MDYEWVLFRRKEVHSTAQLDINTKPGKRAKWNREKKAIS